MTNYLILFTNKAGHHIGKLVTLAASHWDACDFGWNNAPEGTDDFQIYDELRYAELTGASLAD